MKKIWKTVLIAGIATILVVPAMAQQAGPKGGGLQGGAQTGAKRDGKGGGRLLKITKEVLAKVQPPLSAEQKTKVAALDKKTMASMKELRGKAQTGDKTAMRDAMKKISTDYRDGLKAILSPAQQTSYQTLVKEAMAKAKKDGAATGGKVGN